MMRNVVALIGGAVALLVRRSRKGSAPPVADPDDRLFREFAGALPNILFVTDERGGNVRFNRRWDEYRGTHDDFVRQELHVGDEVHPSDRQRVLDAWNLAVASGTAFECRYRLRGADSRYRWFIVRAQPVQRAGEAARWFGVATDIDAQMRAEASLRDREEQLRLALESTGLGIFEIEFWTRRMVWSDRCRAIWGLGRDDALDFRLIRQAIHPTDRARVVAAINRSRDQRGSGDFSFEVRVVRPDGSARIVAALGRSFFVTTVDGEQAIRCIGTMLDITERRNAEQRVRVSEQRLDLAQEAAEVGMWDYDIASRTLQWSPTLYRIFGRIPGAIAENTVTIFRDAIVPEDRERLAEGVRRAIKELTHYSAEYRIKRGDDRIRWISSRGRVERDSAGRAVRFIGVSIDITDAKAASERLAHSEELFRLAAEAVNGIIYDLDPASGRVRRTRGLFEITGYRPEDVPPESKWWIDLIHPEDRDAFERAQQQGLASGATRLQNEYRVRHQAGHWVHVLDRCYLDRDASGNVVRVVGCTQDVTELRLAERSLREADRRKDEFLAVLAHELRNPLAPIRSAAAIMRNAPAGSPPVTQARDMLDRQVAHMVRLIDDLLDVGRITSGKLALRREMASLKTIIDDAVDSARPLVDANRHTLELSVPEPAPIVYCDSARISQVIGNLLTNAAKYTPPGGAIQVVAENGGGEVIVRVRDNGIGIAPEAMTSVFNMFAQVGERPGDRHAGLGVGLPLARSLTALHGGTIEAASDGPGCGTEMIVRLPLERGFSMNELPKEERTAPAMAPTTQRVLVVDDNEDAAESLAALLRLSGHQVAVGYDGRQALDVAAEFDPEVVLLDVSMPRMDGHEAARRLRQTARGASMYIVALSGFGQEHDKAQSLAAGCNAHLIKPVAPADLDAVMAAAIAAAAH